MTVRERTYSYKAQPRYLADNKPQQMLLNWYAVAIACLFYSMGNFGFLNVVGVRREVQVVLILTLLPSIAIIAPRVAPLLKKPLFLLALALAVADIVFRRDFIGTLDHLAAVLVIGLLLSIDKRHSNRVLEYVIVLCSIFSLMGIVQAVFVFTDTELISVLHAPYSSDSTADVIEISHPLAWLGFTSERGAIHLWGHEITRFRSFATEPSSTVVTFLVPGLLALSYTGFIRFCSIPILLFAIVLVQAGVVWLSMLVGLIVWGLLYVFRRGVVLLSLIPFVFILFCFLIVPRLDIPDFVDVMFQPVGATSDDYYSGLTRGSSAIIRLEGMVEAVGLSKQYILGTPFVPELPGVGLLLNMAIIAGVVGSGLLVIVSYRIFTLTGQCFKRYRGIIGLSVVLLYGVLVQVLLFSGYGWTRLPGLLLLALWISRLELLTYKRT